MDQKVLEVQQWLNKTYGDDSRFKKVNENGQTGWPTINALIRATQIELGIQSTADNFGNTSKAKFKEKYPNGIKEQKPDDTRGDNIYLIIQGALWCKGYASDYNNRPFFKKEVAGAIIKLKNDIGIGGDSTVTLDIMDVLLSMKQFVLLSRYGGKSEIRQIQQKVNKEYRNYTGIIPTDGIYGREMNKGLIQVLQAIEGFSPSQATGYFGDGTKSRLKVIDDSNADSNPNWSWLLRSCLICNSIKLTGTLSNSIKEFQKIYALPITGKADINTWMSLMTSKGNPDRKAIACDTRFEITTELLNKLKSDGYKIVGRYLTGGSFKEIREGELERIVKGGLSYFPIFQENGRVLSEFTYTKGLEHGRKASEAALAKGVPPTVIYFAVDMDIYDYQIDSNIIPYFKGINETIDSRYSVGIYASRNVCTRVANVGYSISSFVSDMSTGFSGNLGFPIPNNWNYDQFHEISGYGGNWDLDKVAYSGKIPPCSTVVAKEEYYGDEVKFVNWVRNTEKECLNNFNNILSPWYGYSYVIGRAILEHLRKPTYWGDSYAGLWRIYTPETGVDENEVAARAICRVTCEEQPNIKEKIKSIDIAHMSATILGYVHWGFSENKGNYSLGDLGGWSLDLLQIWGSYLKDIPDENLENWLKNHLGSKFDGRGFDYDDVLADSDAFLLANKGIIDLSENVSKIFRYNKNERIEMFYKERFDSKKENVINSFIKLIDGIDYWKFENLPGTKDLLLKAAQADRLPSKDEANILATVFADYINNPK